MKTLDLLVAHEAVVCQTPAMRSALLLLVLLVTSAPALRAAPGSSEYLDRFFAFYPTRATAALKGHQGHQGHQGQQTSLRSLVSLRSFAFLHAGFYVSGAADRHKRTKLSLVEVAVALKMSPADGFHDPICGGTNCAFSPPVERPAISAGISEEER